MRGEDETRKPQGHFLPPGILVDFVTRISYKNAQFQNCVEHDTAAGPAADAACPQAVGMHRGAFARGTDLSWHTQATCPGRLPNGRLGMSELGAACLFFPCY
jgi:hypothetical protein